MSDSSGALASTMASLDSESVLLAGVSIPVSLKVFSFVDSMQDALFVVVWFVSTFEASLDCWTCSTKSNIRTTRKSSWKPEVPSGGNLWRRRHTGHSNFLDFVLENLDPEGCAL